MTTLVDDRGRILVPKDLRLQFGLEAGAPVIIEADSDGIRLRRAIPRKEAMDGLCGIVTKGNSLDPLQAKRIWEPA